MRKRLELISTPLTISVWQNLVHMRVVMVVGCWSLAKVPVTQITRLSKLRTPGDTAIPSFSKTERLESIGSISKEIYSSTNRQKIIRIRTADARTEERCLLPAVHFFFFRMLAQSFAPNIYNPHLFITLLSFHHWSSQLSQCPSVSSHAFIRLDHRIVVKQRPSHCYAAASRTRPNLSLKRI